MSSTVEMWSDECRFERETAGHNIIMSSQSVNRLQNQICIHSNLQKCTQLSNNASEASLEAVAFVMSLRLELIKAFMLHLDLPWCISGIILESRWSTLIKSQPLLLPHQHHHPQDTLQLSLTRIFPSYSISRFLLSQLFYSKLIYIIDINNFKVCVQLCTP